MTKDLELAVAKRSRYWSTAVTILRRSYFLCPFLILPFAFAATSEAVPTARQGEVVIVRNPETSAANDRSTALNIRRIRSKASGFETVLLPGLRTRASRTQKTSNLAPLYEFCKKLKAEGIAKLCNPNFTYTALDVTPNDPRFGELWGLRKIKAPTAWDTTTGTTETIVAVIDSGIAHNHPDLAPNLWINGGEILGDNIDNDRNGYVDDIAGYDFIDDDGDPMDGNGHGTHCAGTIGAKGNNRIGIVGVNHTVRIMGLRVLDDEGSGSTSGIVEAVNYAANNGAHIESMSLGGEGDDEVFRESIRIAGTKNVLVVVAAGNESVDNDVTPSYPANYDFPNVISVAATDRNDNLADFSNFGKRSVHIAAPGVEILSTWLGGGYEVLDGTSMATPHVAGAAALIRSARPTLSAVQIKAVLLENSDKLATLTPLTISGGRLNVDKALTVGLGLVPDPRTGPPAPTPTPGPVLSGIEIDRPTRRGRKKYAIKTFAYSEDEEYYYAFPGANIGLKCRESDGRRSRTHVKNGSSNASGVFTRTLTFRSRSVVCQSQSGQLKSNSRKFNAK